ncbi:MAG: terminase small subunit [Oscillospiraceae bacterium]|nr:terminase small subunit [Oscillospiraceae bacterium]MBQ9836504.1 terminase small subunit [Oscillospiraceae bacterium]
MDGKKTAAELGRDLNPQYRKFVQEWMVDMNATRAAIAAGYSEKSAAQTASRLMRRTEIRSYRDALMAEAFEDLGVTRHSIASRVWEIYERCMQKKPVMEWNSTTREWIESGEWQFDTKGALKALAMMLEMLPEMEDEDEGGGSYEDTLDGGGGREF